MIKQLVIVLALTALVLFSVPAEAQSGSTELTGNLSYSIFNATAADITATGATIKWQTNGDGTAQVFFDTVSHSASGDTEAYAYATTPNPGPASDHNQILTGLTANTRYYYRVRSVSSVYGEAVSNEMTFTTSSEGPGKPGGGSGGGGGGGGDRDDDDDVDEEDSNKGTLKGVNLTPYLNSNGVFKSDLTIEGPGSNCNLFIPEGTVARNADGQPLSWIYIGLVPEENQPASPPVGGFVIGANYAMEPDGATFSPPVIVILQYDETLIPESVPESELVMGCFDGSSGKWTALSGCSVNTAKNVITAPLSHFSTHAVLGYEPPPPAITVSGLSISPVVVAAGEPATISARISNTGGIAAVYKADLLLNNTLMESRNVNVAAGATETVSFTLTLKATGTYSIALQNLTGELEVTKPPTPSIFSLSALSVSPLQVSQGDEFTVSALVKNWGDLEGSYPVKIKIGDQIVRKDTVNLSGHDEQTISYTLEADTPGTYLIWINEYSAEIQVAGNQESPSPKPYLYILLFLGAVSITILVRFLISRSQQ